MSELLGDFEAFGWISLSRFAGPGGWALTDAGRTQNRRQLADEVDACGARAEVARAHAAFDPLNARFLETVTRGHGAFGQVVPVGVEPCVGVSMGRVRPR